MTIHDSHPFAEPESERDPVRRLRGRLGGAVTLWTAGDDAGRAGLTVSSVLVAGGSPGRVLGLVDPDSDLADVVERTGRAVVHVLSWSHRDLADAFAGVAPAPGGAFRLGDFEDTAHGPRLTSVGAWAFVTVEPGSSVEVGWSRLLTCTVDEVGLEEDQGGLGHRRGRYLRLDQP
ncbi:MAG TPA: flavin reductase family protein [Nocardioides sp.]|nr:flavin reductase family protein [Nocardioides sp.]